MSNHKAVPENLADQFFKGESMFFSDKPQEAPKPEPAAEPPATTPASPVPSSPPAQVVNKPARQPKSKSTSQPASTLASYQQELIETIRRTVKNGGRIVSFVRLTQQEKDQLADIVYTYKRRGKKTTENEINRIAINYLLEDYQRNGEESLLAQVIDALLA